MLASLLEPLLPILARLIPEPSALTENATNQHPLIGRIFHLVVVCGAIAGPGIFVWQMADDFARSLTYSAAAIITSAALWYLPHTPRDPDGSPIGSIRIHGRLRLILEILLIVLGGVTIWASWNRAAAETYLTLAVLVYALRFPRLLLVWNLKRTTDQSQ